MMNILVIGCAHVGAALVRDLELAGNDVSLVDERPENLRRLEGFSDYVFHGTALVGNPTDPEVLRRAGIENCDAVAVVGIEDAENLMAAQIAKNVFGKTKVLCRVSDANLASIYNMQYGLETICPTTLTVNAAFSALEHI